MGGLLRASDGDPWVNLSRTSSEVSEGRLRKIRAAIIGSGLIAGKKHIPAFLRLRPTTELVAVCDLNLSAAKQVAARFGIPKAYGNIAEMMNTEKPDLVDICTPPQTHARLAVEAMRHGCHVLIEKPMALTVADCDQIVKASKDYGLKVCVAHSDLFYGPFIKARRMVGDGVIGRVRGMRIFLSTPTNYMTSRPEHWAHKLPGGVIGETGPHIVYMTLAFIPHIRTVNVDALKVMRDYPWSLFEDYRINLIGDDAISSATVVYTTEQWAAKVEILGDTGFLMLDLESMSVVHYKRAELKPVPVGFSLLREGAELAGAFVSNAIRVATRRVRSTHEIIISQLADSILSGSEPPVSAEEGREAVRVLNMVVEDIETKFATKTA
jgi:predicted dehydrogenase